MAIVVLTCLYAFLPQWEKVVEEKALSVAAVTKDKNALAEEVATLTSTVSALNKQIELFSDQVGPQLICGGSCVW